MQKHLHSCRGLTLVETVVGIVILAIISITIFKPVFSSLSQAPNIVNNSLALELAQQRMEIIMAQKHTQGFGSYSDPCPAAAVCTVPAGFTVASSIAGNWMGNTNYNVITVTVSGDGDAELTVLVADY